MNGLELQDILLTFPEGGKRRTVLDIPYLQVTSGEHVGIRGASGSGKSSLLNVVSGLVLPDRGTVRWGATVPGALARTPARSLARAAYRFRLSGLPAFP